VPISYVFDLSLPWIPQTIYLSLPLVTKPPEALLTWKTVALKLPWNIIILLGSGFALAEACKVQERFYWSR
jgi:di/tricarboxylate transporter